MGRSGEADVKNRLTALVEEYRRRPESQGGQSIWAFVAERDPYLFSHHPSSPAFREHVWEIGGLYFCKGCVVTFAGMLAGTVLFAASGWLRWFSDLQIGAIFILLLMPTLLVHLLRLPRWCRHLSRFLLGILLASALFLLFVTESWWVRIAVVMAYFVTKIPLARKRRISHS